MTLFPFALDRRRGAALAMRGIVAAGLALALSGCYTAREATVPVPPTDYRLRHPIVIKEGPRTVELFIGTSRGGLTAAQRADVLAFAQDWRRESTGGVIVDVPAGTSNARAAADALHEVRSLLAAGGVPPRSLAIRPYRPASPRVFATIKLSYPKVVAQAGPCGLWPNDLGPSTDPAYLDNRPFYNLGCSSQRNLAAMVDNPADLVQPRGETPVFAARRSAILEHYRKGENTATQYPTNPGAKISDVGK